MAIAMPNNASDHRGEQVLLPRGLMALVKPYFKSRRFTARNFLRTFAHPLKHALTEGQRQLNLCRRVLLVVEIGNGQSKQANAALTRMGLIHQETSYLI